MAFCNSCGATLNSDAKFCNKCGAAISGSPASAAPTPLAPPPSKGGSSTVKVLLIIAAVIVILGILGIISLALVARHFLANSHVTQDGNQVKIETPFGKVETNKDPEQAAHDQGIEIYPGAQAVPNSAATTTFGSVVTFTSSFQTSDPPNKVCDFYKTRYPNAMVTTSDQNRCTIASKDQKNMITINAEARADGTRFQITNVSKGPNNNMTN